MKHYLSVNHQEINKDSSISHQKVKINDLYLKAEAYDGKDVEFEAYLYICNFEYFENPRFCISDTDKNESGTIGFVDLRFAEMKPTVFQREFKINERGVSENRIKVIIKGESRDYCNPPTNCDFGRLIYLKAQEVIQLEPAGEFEEPDYVN